MLGERSDVVDRKLDLLVGELKRYGGGAVGFGGGRWFGGYTRLNVYVCVRAGSCIDARLSVHVCVRV